VLEIETVTVLGASEGGTACAVLAALAGCAVRVHDASEAALASGCAEVRRRVEHALAQGAISRAGVQRVLDGVLFTADLDEALTGADLAVDAGPAAPGLAERLAAGLRATATIAAAGATAPAELAARVPQPGRVLALRLAGGAAPVPRLEVLPGPGTSTHVIERARAFAARVNALGRDGRRPQEQP
jgi:3-hydroxybutyryl-CoA dehydrogenase